MAIKNHKKTAHSPSTLEKIKMVPIGGKLSDITKTFGSTYRRLDPKRYKALGELKGGIDPAGADEHWKTANTALSRVRDNFAKYGIKIPLFFIGAAIEVSMSKEIFNQYSTGKIVNCANLTVEKQLISLCNWLVKLK